ncbi:aromatic ring-opening dioxygenase [Rhodococcus rhodochrous]|uniref:DODA-type extradiol aromatic ring-opening family dioxygenase n=1 Tax=Rhodococcus rhodochrous TaxID=1829 RepID=UPI000750BD01|nr:hypothetical protein [Rhodococcus rhodochrous]MDO1484632.1 hypothetical protein [Rhodococcus rhodochrous]SNV27208.1 aromatic ring-opening dioxygenase [Rhodococcus rhodochrous]
MIGLGLACSHAAGMFRPPEAWQQWMIDRVAPGVFERYPEAARQRDSLEVCQDLYHRIHAAFDDMRAEVAAYKPDVIVIVGDDQGDMFNLSNNPSLAIYVGSEPMWGHQGYEWDVPMKDRTVVKFKNDPDVSSHLARQLVKRHFDVSVMHRFEPVGREGYGLPHMAARIAPELDPTGEIPVVCVMLNEYFPPLAGGDRCAALGRAIAEILGERDERILLCASGGLSHYPSDKDFNRGDIDTPLDKWVLERIQRNEVDQLEKLFSFDSQTLRSGTGEIRAWISVAAAMDRPATVIDYMPIHACFTGVGFAKWTDRH